MTSEVSGPTFSPGVQRVLHAELDDEPDQAHDAELGDLVDQHLKPEVVVADQTQLAQFLSPVGRLACVRCAANTVPLVYGDTLSYPVAGPKIVRNPPRSQVFSRWCPKYLSAPEA